MDDTLRKLAIQDVMVTGDSVFAKTAQLSAAIIENSSPAEPMLEFPEDNQKNVASSVSFTWNSSNDTDNDALSYRLYVWSVDKIPDDNQAISLGRSNAAKLSRTVSRLEPGQSYYWKVIVEDGRGGVSESVIRRFTVNGQAQK
jgi:hypothetical protein